LFQGRENVTDLSISTLGAVSFDPGVACDDDVVGLDLTRRDRSSAEVVISNIT
jgi:hypothetical protein